MSKGMLTIGLAGAATTCILAGMLAELMFGMHGMMSTIHHGATKINHLFIAAQ